MNNGDVQGDQKTAALKIEGPKNLDLEGKIQVLENILQQCAIQKVEEHEIQRFLGRIFTAARTSGFLLGVDHAIFKSEHDHIRLLEASLNESNLDRKEKRVLLDRLLSLALPKGLNTNLLEQSTNGQSWVPANDSDVESEGELKIDMSTITDNLMVDEATTQTDEKQESQNCLGKNGI